MDNCRADFQRGLIYFCCLMTCVVLAFTTPDGYPLLNKLLGLLGISPVIEFGSSGTFYFFNTVLAIIAIFSLVKTRIFWKGYGFILRGCNAKLRFLPTIIALSVFLISNMAMSPSVIDRIYFYIISQRTGLQAVTFYTYNNINFTFNGNNRRYSYDMFLSNHSNERLEFNVLLVYEPEFPGVYQEVLITDENGQARTFSLAPRQSGRFTDEFDVYHPTEFTSGFGSQLQFYIVLLNDNEKYIPSPLARHPILN